MNRRNLVRGNLRGWDQSNLDTADTNMPWLCRSRPIYDMTELVDDVDMDIEPPCDELWGKGVEWGFRLDEGTKSDSHFETKLAFERRDDDPDEDDDGNQGGSFGQQNPTNPVFGNGSGNGGGPTPPPKSKSNPTVC